MVGWGIDRHLSGQLVHTVDGGRTWTNATPPGVSLDIPPYKDLQSNLLPEPPADTVTDVLSKFRAIVVTERSWSTDGKGVLLLVEDTTTGGRQWQQWTVFLPHLADTAVHNPSPYGVDFVNAKDGWLELEGIGILHADHH